MCACCAVHEHSIGDSFRWTTTTKRNGHTHMHAHATRPCRRMGTRAVIHYAHTRLRAHTHTHITHITYTNAAYTHTDWIYYCHVLLLVAFFHSPPTNIIAFDDFAGDERARPIFQSPPTRTRRCQCRSPSTSSRSCGEQCSKAFDILRA